MSVSVTAHPRTIIINLIEGIVSNAEKSQAVQNLWAQGHNNLHPQDQIPLIYLEVPRVQTLRKDLEILFETSLEEVPNEISKYFCDVRLNDNVEPSWTVYFGE